MTNLERLQAAKMPFAELMGIEFIEAELERVVAQLKIRDDLCTTGRIVHGGALMALADSVGAAGTILNLPEDAKGTATIESKTNFIGAGPAGTTLTAVATPIHRGGRSQVWQTRIETESGKLIALVTQTQLVL
jgi:1,4-dihydroxy-2-naphthoyl-CoA hydrolase